MSSFRISMACIISILILSAGCSKKNDTIPLIDRGEWLVTIDQDTIYVNDFISRYESTPHFGSGLSGVTDYLKAVVVENILADYALESPQLDRFEYYRKFSEQLETEVLVETILLKKINERTTAEESEIKEHYDRLTKRLTLNALSVRDSISACVMAEKLQNGSDIRDVVRSNRRAILNTISSQELIYNDSDPVFENTAYSLQDGEYSDPVYSTGSWWIIQRLKTTMDRFPSENDLQNNREFLKSVIIKRKMKVEQTAYIKSVMKGRNVDINEDSFSILVTKLKNVFDSIESPSKEQTKLIASRNFEIKQIQNYDPNLPLMEMKGFSKNKITLGDALEWFSTSPRNTQFERNEYFAQKVYSELLYMVEFLALAEEAEKSDIKNDLSVKLESELWSTHVFGQYGMTRLSLETGKKLQMSGFTSNTDVDMKVADSLMVEAIDSLANNHNIKFNWAQLNKVDATTPSVFLRKTHFPARPMAPMPIGYRWAMLWEP